MSRRAATKGTEIQSAKCELRLKTPLTVEQQHELDQRIALAYVELMQAQAALATAKERIKAITGKLEEEGRIRARGYNEGPIPCLAELIAGKLVYTRLDTGVVIPDDELPNNPQWSLGWNDRERFKAAGLRDEDDDDQDDDESGDDDESAQG